MTPEDLDAIEARHSRHASPGVKPWCEHEADDWPCDAAALVAALRAEREEVARLTALAESNWRSLEREAWEHARTLTDYTGATT